MTSPAADTPGIVAFIEARCDDDENKARQQPSGTARRFGKATAGRMFAYPAMRRAILALHRSVADEHHHAWCAEDGRRYPCQTVRLLAAIDADHASFDPSWKPVAG